MPRKKKGAAAAGSTAVASAGARAAAEAETAVLGADWVATLREVMQDVQTLALERTGHHQQHIEAQSTPALHTASLAPALRRLRRVFKDEIGSGDTLVEESWALFRDEIWLVIARVLTTQKLSAAVVLAFGAFFGEFFAGADARDRRKSDGRASTSLRKRHYIAHLASSSTDSARKQTKQQTDARSLIELRVDILGRLADVTAAEDKHVRLRVCHFLQLVLNKIDFMEDDLYEHLRTALLPRASDKLSAVRVQSVYALKRLQDLDEANDAVTAELLRLLVSDPSKDVRKAAALSVAVTPAAYHDLLIRIRDTSDDVRFAVFRVFGDQMNLRDIPINDRAHLLDQGLQDRSPLVRKACEDMVLRQWLPTCHDSPVALLKALDIEQFPTIGSFVSRIVLKHVGETPGLEDAVPHNALEILAQNSDACDAESIFFWREQCFYYDQVDRDLDKVAALLPNISDYCKLVVVACEAGAEMFFIAQQLLALGHLLDFQDEFGRRKLLDCLQKMLRNFDTETDLIASIMELMARIHAGSSDQAFIQVVAEITSDLYDPLEEKDNNHLETSDTMGIPAEEREAAANRFEELELQLEELEPDSNEYIAIQNEMIDLEKMLQDPDVLRRLRCLEVVSQLLKLTASTLRDPIIAGMGRYILPAIESDVPAVREAGMEALGLFCLLDKAFAERHMLVFWRALGNDDEERDVKLNCIKALFDMLVSFAHLEPKSMVPPIKQEAGDEIVGQRVDALDLETVLFGLAELLYIDDLDVQATLVEGFCKLLLLNRIRTVAVVTQLLELFFSPLLQTVQLEREHGYQSRSLQLLSVFFPAFVASNKTNCALLEEATILLLQRAIAALDVADADAALLDVSNCVKYVVHLLRHGDAGVDAVSKRQAPAAAATRTAACAHANRIGLHMCIDVLALEQLVVATQEEQEPATDAVDETDADADSAQPAAARRSPPSRAPGGHMPSSSTIDSDQVLARQKVLLKALMLIDIVAFERRSAALFHALVAQVATTCCQTQRGLVRSIDAFVKRTAAAMLGDKNDDAMETDGEDDSVVTQDVAWAMAQVTERAAVLESVLEDATMREQQRRSQKLRLAKKKRRAGTFSSSEEESDDESDDESDEDGESEEADDGENAAHKKPVKQPKEPVVRREMSSRKSKQVASERIASREFDVQMQIAFASDEENDEEESESEEEGESESGDGDEEEEEASAAEDDDGSK